MQQDLQNTIALLSRTPKALDALLRDLPEGWIFRNEGENTWSAFDIVGHLAPMQFVNCRLALLLQWYSTSY